MHILLADDHAMFRSGLRKILENQYPEASIAEASSCKQVLDSLGQGQWSITILDISMGSQNSLSILPELKKLQPGMPVLVLSMYNDRQFIVQALKAGAAGYITKEHTPEELVKGIETILSGSKYISESVAANLAGYLALGETDNPHEKLSSREYEVFMLIASGRSLSEIASELSLSIKTISTYRARIIDKMALGSNAEIMRYALRKGLVR